MEEQKKRKQRSIKNKLENKSDDEDLDAESLLNRDLTMREFLVGKKAAKHMISYLRKA